MTTLQNWKNQVEKLYKEILRKKHDNHIKTVEVSFFFLLGFVN